VTRFGYVVTTYFAVVTVGVFAFLPVGPKLIWNASASVPLGLYSIEPARHLEITDLVAVRTPEPLASFMAERRYLPRGVPLMKRVAAIAGQQVCRDGARITIGGIDMGEALARDRAGRALPSWQGCRRIADGEVFLMNWTAPDSVDGRYFGPLPINSVIGRAIPLWTDEDGDGRFQWRAATR
jgi:conjugative transfer signal peptidase TraF